MGIPEGSFFSYLVTDFEPKFSTFRSKIRVGTGDWYISDADAVANAVAAIMESVPQHEKVMKSVETTIEMLRECYHGTGFIHGDLHGDNLLVDDSGRIKLFDFLIFLKSVTETKKAKVEVC